MEIPTINLDNTFDFETMYTADDAGSLRAHNVANDEMQVFATNDQMQVFEANDEMQVFATNDQMQVFEANDEMQLFEEMSDHADTMHTSVATGATTATANTISSEHSGTDDSEAQSAPSQDFLCSTQVPYLTLTFNSEEEARAHYNRYAKCVGFSIKINTSRKSAKDGERDKPCAAAVPVVVVARGGRHRGRQVVAVLVRRFAAAEDRRSTAVTVDPKTAAVSSSSPAPSVAPPPLHWSPHDSLRSTRLRSGGDKPTGVAGESMPLVFEGCRGGTSGHGNMCGIVSCGYSGTPLARVKLFE
uniref:Protein FAR1-RELATED SEQUENCE n=1 Tax=Oryza sativa subsp. japonica TaxID=39947 RepID=Q6K4H0_ORYSJ|nr:hypothetical protein [Oryza sativa Japonica Group]BAD23383.1 hypothetical protein [Oryza sativa Japonica Group]